jgi:hypothetical protein
LLDQKGVIRKNRFLQPDQISGTIEMLLKERRQRFSHLTQSVILVA